jgi:hypothetical protein
MPRGHPSARMLRSETKRALAYRTHPGVTGPTAVWLSLTRLLPFRDPVRRENAADVRHIRGLRVGIPGSSRRAPHRRSICRRRPRLAGHGSTSILSVRVPKPSFAGCRAGRPSWPWRLLLQLEVLTTPVAPGACLGWLGIPERLPANDANPLGCREPEQVTGTDDANQTPSSHDRHAVSPPD